jgi:hypothetical protein
VQGQPAAAARLFEQAAEADSATDPGYAVRSLGQAGHAHLAAGRRSQALAATRRGTDQHRTAGLAPLNGGDRVKLWWALHLALHANGRRAEAGEALVPATRPRIVAMTANAMQAAARGDSPPAWTTT